MPYTFAPMPEPQSATAQAIVNAITSLQDAISNLDVRATTVESSASSAAVTGRLDALEAADTTFRTDLTNLQDQVGLLNNDVTALKAGGVPNAITSPDGSVRTIEAGTKAANDARGSLPNTSILLDRG